jgi:hypothetical protein
MKIGDKVIITKDQTCHGIPPGKVCEVIKIPAPYIVGVAYNEGIRFPHSSEIVELIHDKEMEQYLQERDYKRFWWLLKNSPFILASILMAVLALGFFTWDDGFLLTNITTGFVCLTASGIGIYVLKKEKEEFERKLLTHETSKD